MRSLEFNWDRFQALNTVPWGTCTPSAGMRQGRGAPLKNLPLISDFCLNARSRRTTAIIHEEFG
jgi:hypothetical protein